MFLLTSKFCPQVVVCPCSGLYTGIKYDKNVYKNQTSKGVFLKLVTNDRSDKMSLLISKFRPQEVVNPCPEAIHMYKIMKKCV